VQTTSRTIRVQTLRRLERRLDRTIALQRAVNGSPTRELTNLSIELQRQLARLEELPWPSNRSWVSNESRPLEQRLVPALRAARLGYSPSGKA
jgi:hypothetical protein